ncbi:hypothetical protein M0R45_007112 [Rubus argutus]|uniref:Uncharacterized protein n=1 Tax=Rubus argutus TaxID=59490 RepID=A0AAW1YSH1_RUBAR
MSTGNRRRTWLRAERRELRGKVACRLGRIDAWVRQNPGRRRRRQEWAVVVVDQRQQRWSRRGLSKAAATGRGGAFGEDSDDGAGKISGHGEVAGQIAAGLGSMNDDGVAGNCRDAVARLKEASVLGCCRRRLEVSWRQRASWAFVD